MVLMMLLQPSSSCVSQARMWNKSAQKARSCTVHNPVAAECWKQTKNSWRTLQHVAANEGLFSGCAARTSVAHSCRSGHTTSGKRATIHANWNGQCRTLDRTRRSKSQNSSSTKCTALDTKTGSMLMPALSSESPL